MSNTAALARVRAELDHIATVPVYFAQSVRNDEIKIGFSTNVSERLYLLGRSRLTDMDLLGWLPGGFKVEREMHDRFKDLALGHEWFSPAPELLEFIKTSTRHDEPNNIASPYGRMNDAGYDSLLHAERRYLALTA